MRILLIIPQGNYPTPPPSLDLIGQGHAYVAGALTAAGHEVMGVVTSYEFSSEPVPVLLGRLIRERVSFFQPELIAIGGLAAEYLFIRDAITLSRKAAAHIPIVLGGGILTNDRHAFELLKPDFGLMDEAEISIVELVAHLAAGTRPDLVRSLAYWRDGKAIYNPVAEPLEDLDSLPYPDYEPLNLRTYLEMQNQSDNYFHVRTRIKPRMMPILSGRSCPFKCTFCQYSTLGGSRRRYRGRQMTAVVDEIAHFTNMYGINIIKIYDDLFSVKEQRVREFCSLIKEACLDINWNASMRVGDVTEDLLREMKDAGCIHIGYGFESASNAVLKSMNKRVTRAEIQRAIDISEKVGIGIQGNFIYGDPAETIETVEETWRFYRNHCHHHIVHNDYLMPYPGSPIFDTGLASGAIRSKNLYYESIHMRPRYNLTKMPQIDFFRSLEAVIEPQLGDLPFLTDVQFSEMHRGTDFRHEYFDSKLLLQVDGRCPHCMNPVTCVFPKERNSFSLYKLFAPIRYYCKHCHRRFLVSTMNLFGLELEMEKWSESLRSLAETRKPVVVTPLPTIELFDACDAYVSISKLDIHSFLASTAVHSGTQWEGRPVLPVNQISRYAHLDHIVLPVPDSDKLVGALLSNNVSRELIHALNTSVCIQTPALDRPLQKPA